MYWVFWLSLAFLKAEEKSRVLLCCQNTDTFVIGCSLEAVILHTRFGKPDTRLLMYK